MDVQLFSHTGPFRDRTPLPRVSNVLFLIKASQKTVPSSCDLGSFYVFKNIPFQCSLSRWKQDNGEGDHFLQKIQRVRALTWHVGNQHFLEWIRYNKTWHATFSIICNCSDHQTVFLITFVHLDTKIFSNTTSIKTVILSQKVLMSSYWYFSVTCTSA